VSWGRFPLRRRRSDVVWFAGAFAVLAVCSLAIDGDSASTLELRLFRLANDLPNWVYPVLWPLMQFGTFIVVPVVAIIALVFRRIRFGIEVAIAGVGAYVLAKVVKDLFPRSRPGVFVDDVHLRGIGTGGRGYPSGHSATSAAVTYVVFAFLPRRWRWVPVALAVIVSSGRVYVGGHFPLDVVGGAALGIVTAALVTFVGGVVDRREGVEWATESETSGTQQR
jgi:membrane-associated phospholipid phosphatase